MEGQILEALSNTSAQMDGVDGTVIATENEIDSDNSEDNVPLADIKRIKLNKDCKNEHLKCKNSSAKISVCGKEDNQFLEPKVAVSDKKAVPDVMANAIDSLEQENFSEIPTDAG